MFVLWAGAVIGGLALTIFSSRQTLDAARTIATGLGLSPFIIGMTIVAIGTDLPEIANSITASATDHGDVNVGDSIGSVVTQITLVLGILCFVSRIPVERRFMVSAGFVTVLSVLLGAGLLRDAHLSRTDGLVLLAFWAVGTMAVQHTGHFVSARQEALFSRSVLVSLRDLMVGLGGVALGAVVAVRGFIEVAEALSVPEYATSFIVLSLGTSLPELVIDGQALRKGDSSLAMGDIVGSSFVDATLSLGIGPALFPVAVSTSAYRGSLVAALLVALAVLVLLARPEHGRTTGAVLIVLYASSFVVAIL